jgi:hypothetical protein
MGLVNIYCLSSELTGVQNDLLVEHAFLHQEMLQKTAATLWKQFITTAKLFNEFEDANQFKFNPEPVGFGQYGLLAYVVTAHTSDVDLIGHYRGAHVSAESVFTATYEKKPADQQLAIRFAFEFHGKKETLSKFLKEPTPLTSALLMNVKLYLFDDEKKSSSPFLEFTSEQILDENFVLKSPVVKLIDDTRQTLAKVNESRVATRDTLFQDLERVKSDQASSAMSLMRASTFLRDAGTEAQTDHEHHTGWRWFGMFFENRLRAPLIFPTSTFKQKTDTLIAKHQPKS